MAGYRQSSFDPNAYQRYGKPLRPYNWAQWLGVVFAVLGVLGYFAYAADRLGWISIGFDSPAPFISLPLIGVALINSRREGQFIYNRAIPATMKRYSETLTKFSRRR